MRKHPQSLWWQSKHHRSAYSYHLELELALEEEVENLVDLHDVDVHLVEVEPVVKVGKALLIFRGRSRNRDEG